MFPLCSIFGIFQEIAESVFPGPPPNFDHLVGGPLENNDSSHCVSAAAESREFALGSFRFVHTGDIHLDSPLKGLSGQQGAAAERIRTATRVALDNLVTQAIEDEIDFVVIAGDLYDGDWRDYQTGLFFVKQMGRLAQAKIPVFLLHGNHDAESQITRKLTLPTNVSVFPARKAETFRSRISTSPCTARASGSATSQTTWSRLIRHRLRAVSTSASCTPPWAACRDTRTMRRAPSKT
jgi:predicted MPP superfamily phosphohydrolase